MPSAAVAAIFLVEKFAKGLGAHEGCINDFAIEQRRFGLHDGFFAVGCNEFNDGIASLGCGDGRRFFVGEEIA